MDERIKHTVIYLCSAKVPRNKKHIENMVCKDAKS